MSDRKTDTKMADTVDMDALREHVDTCSDCGGTLANCRAARVACCPDCQHFKPIAVDQRALCDEVDRLRAELAEGMALTKQYAKDSARDKRLLERDVHHLRAVIENAPHADDCCYLEEDAVEPGTRISQNAHCTCWKSTAL